MPLFRSIVEALRTLRRCPGDALLLRATGREAELLPVPDDLSGIALPWEPRPPPGVVAAGPAGATWMPQLGAVAWEADPDVHADADLLRRWSRGRLREVLHAARLADSGRDAAAAAFAIRRVEAFLARCAPFGCDHWRSGMEIALRSVRLLSAAARLRSAREQGVPMPSLGPIARALELHEQALQSRADWRLHRTGNHFLVALAGRVLLASSLPPHPLRERRLSRDARLFASELERQVEPGGMHFESSTHYLLLVAEAAAHVRHAVGARGLAGEPIFSELAGALDALLRADGTIASVGDGDDESFLPSATGSDPPAVVRAKEIAEALGPSTSRAGWSSGGLHVLEGDGLHVTVSSCGRGRAGNGGHFHDDATSAEIWLGGALLGHRGTGAYAADLPLRERLRAIESHAAIQVDSRRMNDAIRGQAFRRRFRAHPWWTRGDASSLDVGHHGFATPAPGVVVLRRFRLGPDGLVIEDELTGSGTHALTLRLPWAPGIELGSPASVPGGSAEPGGSIGFDVLRAGARIARVTVEARAEGRPLPLRMEHRPDTHWPRQGEPLPALTTVVLVESGLPVVVRHVVRPGAWEPAGAP